MNMINIKAGDWSERRCYSVNETDRHKKNSRYSFHDMNPELHQTDDKHYCLSRSFLTNFLDTARMEMSIYDAYVWQWWCKWRWKMFTSGYLNEVRWYLVGEKMLHRRKKKLGVLLIEHENVIFRFVFRTLYHWAIDNSLPVRPFN